MRDQIKTKATAAEATAREALGYLRAKRDLGVRLSHPPGHYYSPIPSAADIKRVADREEGPSDVIGVDIREHAQLELIAELATTSGEMPFGDAQQGGMRYWFKNPMFSNGDGTVLYAILRHFKPTRLIEVGSGFSSALMLDVNDRYDLAAHFTFIEPYPDRLNALLRPEDAGTATILPQAVQDVDPRVFDQLAAGDVLFIDSSHVSKTGSDLNHLIFEVLPRLSPGVIVHFHDIWWPFEYPTVWLHEGRAWNEIYLLRAFLSYNDRFKVLLFNNWLAKTHPDKMRSLFRGWEADTAGSLWLQVV